MCYAYVYSNRTVLLFANKFSIGYILIVPHGYNFWFRHCAETLARVLYHLQSVVAVYGVSSYVVVAVAGAKLVLLCVCVCVCVVVIGLLTTPAGRVGVGPYNYVSGF